LQNVAGKYAVQALKTVPGGRAPNCTGFASTVYITLRTELSKPPRLRCGPESLEVCLFAENDLSTEQWAFASTLVSVAANVLRQAQPDQLSVARAVLLPFAGTGVLVSVVEVSRLVMGNVNSWLQVGVVAAALGLTYSGLLLPAWRRGVAA
jgi:hypothetical protein